jgi:hypothetical protein
MVNEFNLQQHVIHLGFLDKQRIEEEMINADYFLITSSKVENGRDYSIAGKTFEYFSYRKPIIGLVTEGEQKDILEESGISLILDPDSLQKNSAKLRGFIQIKEFRPNWELINKFKIPNNYYNLSLRLKGK